MRTLFWTSTAATWGLARFAVLALVAFVALQGVVGVWIATLVGLVVVTLSLIDEVVSRRRLSRRTEVTDRGTGASA